MRKNKEPEEQNQTVKWSREILIKAIEERLNQQDVYGHIITASILAQESGWSPQYIIGTATALRKQGFNIPKKWGLLKAYVSKRKAENPELFEKK